MESLGNTENRKKAGLQFYSKTNKNRVRCSARKKKEEEDFQKQDEKSHETRGNKDILNVKLKWSFSWSLRRKVHWWSCHVLCFKNIVLFGLWCQLHLTETLAYARSVWGIRLVVQNMSVGRAARAMCVCGSTLCYNHFYISKIRTAVYHFCCLTSQNINISIFMCAWFHCYNILRDLISHCRYLYVKCDTDTHLTLSETYIIDVLTALKLKYFV